MNDLIKDHLTHFKSQVNHSNRYLPKSFIKWAHRVGIPRLFCSLSGTFQSKTLGGFKPESSKLNESIMTTTTKAYLTIKSVHSFKEALYDRNLRLYSLTDQKIAHPYYDSNSLNVRSCKLYNIQVFKPVILLLTRSIVNEIIRKIIRKKASGKS